MRTLGAIVAALIGAALGFFLVGFIGCSIAMSADSIPVALATIFLSFGAAIFCGFLGARMVLRADSLDRKNIEAMYRAKRKNE